MHGRQGRVSLCAIDTLIISIDPTLSMQKLNVQYVGWGPERLIVDPGGTWTWSGRL